MAEKTGIAWTDSTFNPWMSLPQALASLQFARVANAVRLEVTQLMARMAKRHAVAHVVGLVREFCQWFFVVSAQVTAGGVAAVTARVFVALEHGIAPYDVLRRAPQTQFAPKVAALEGVVLFSSRSSLARDGRNACLCLIRMRCPKSIGWPSLGRFAHLEPRLSTHHGALHYHG